MNVSVRRAGEQALRTRVVVKNLNSFRHVREALVHEIARQTGLRERDEPVRAQTRSWNEAAGATEVLREKEEAPDYRYFPEPDLPPLVLESGFVERVRAGLPELPAARTRRYERELGLPAHDAAVLAARRVAAELFEDVASRLAAAGVDAAHRRASAFVLTEVLRDVGRDGEEDPEGGGPPVDAERLAELLGLAAGGAISNLAAKEVYREMLSSAEHPAAIVARGLAQVSDTEAIEGRRGRSWRSIPRRPRVRAGNFRVLGFLVARSSGAWKAGAIRGWRPRPCAGCWRGRGGGFAWLSRAGRRAISRRCAGPERCWRS